MIAYGLGPLVFISGSVDSKKYKSIIQNYVIPTMEEITQYTSEPIFQDDSAVLSAESAPCRRARIVRKITYFLFFFTLAVANPYAEFRHTLYSTV